jgi:hypothetical protein
VTMSPYMSAARRPPQSDPQNSHDFRPSATQVRVSALQDNKHCIDVYSLGLSVGDVAARSVEISGIFFWDHITPGDPERPNWHGDVFRQYCHYRSNGTRRAFH